MKKIINPFQNFWLILETAFSSLGQGFKKNNLSIPEIVPLSNQR